MGSLFQGSPQTATSYTTSSTETPKWMQDAIYNQIQVAQNLANTPYQAYSLPTVADLSPLQQQAYQNVQQDQGAWKPALDSATAGMQANANAPGGAAAAQPYLQQAGGMSGLTAAQPYLDQAGQSSIANINDYMNPYTQNVTDQIAKLGARNLTENLLPGVSDSFVRAGSFGGTRMGEFGERALRDTQDSILNQQSQALQSGYGQALGASQADLARQAQLGSTVGGMTQQQQQLLASLGSTQGQLTGADLTRQQSALGQIGQLAQQGQQMQTTDNAALEAAGAGQQANTQAKLTAAQQAYQQQQLYPQQQMDWLNTQIRGMAPITPQNTITSGSTTGQTYSASPLSQLATGLSTYAGLNNMK